MNNFFRIRRLAKLLKEPDSKIFRCVEPRNFSTEIIIQDKFVEGISTKEFNCLKNKLDLVEERTVNPWVSYYKINKFLNYVKN